MTNNEKRLGSMTTFPSIPNIIKSWLNICYKTGVTDFIFNTEEILNSSAIYKFSSFISEVRLPSLKITCKSFIVVFP